MRTRRIEQGLEQEEFAERLRKLTDDQRWNQQRISRLETGQTRFSIEDLRVIAQVQNMPYSWYLDGPESGYRRLREAGLSRSNGNVTDIREILGLRSYITAQKLAESHAPSLASA